MKRRIDLVSRRLPLRPVALALLCAGTMPALAQILPSWNNFTAPYGGVTVGTPTALGNGGQALQINQSLHRAVINWQSFSIGAKDRVNIDQPLPSSVLLNRVVGNDLSTIAGSLTAKGHVFLVNPNGVVFGSGAQVNVGGLVASTLKIDDSNFMPAGKQNTPLGKGDVFSFSGDAASTAKVIVQGAAGDLPAARITTTSAGGTVALVGAQVSNGGVINVAQGSAGLVAASAMTLEIDPAGDGLTTFRIPVTNAAKTALVENLAGATVQADGGRVALLASSVEPLQTVVNQQGILRARTLENRNGEIQLFAGVAPTPNIAKVGGTLDVTGTEAGQKGGTIFVAGGDVRLSGATLDASGTAGGGNVVVVASQTASLSADSTARSDALQSGDGGLVALGGIGDGAQLRVDGTLSATGAGSGSGGGIVTGSYMTQVGEGAQIGAAGGAAGGANGKWQLLAGTDLLVHDGATPGDVAARSSASAQTIGRTLGRGTDVTLSSKALQNHDSTGVGVSFGKDAQVVKTEGGTATLTVNSSRSIRMEAGSSITSSAGALNVDFNADAAGTPLPADPPPIASPSPDGRLGAISLNAASIHSNGGNIRFYGQSDPTNGRAVAGAVTGVDAAATGISLFDSVVSTCASAAESCSGGGNISLRGQGAGVRLNDTLVFTGSGVRINGGKLLSGSGDISLDGRGALGASGVFIGQATVLEGDPPSMPSPSVRSGSGTITMVGSSSGWSSTSNPGRFVTGDNGITGGDGVFIGGATVVTGGDIVLDGRGGDISALVAQTAFQNQVTPGGVGSTASISDGSGVQINASRLAAGEGRSLTVSGSGGSRGYTLTRTGAESVELTEGSVAANGVDIAGWQDRGLSAAGGTIRIDGRDSNVWLRFIGNSDAQELSPTPVLDVASSSGAGGTIDVRGRNVLVEGINDIARLDASGMGQGGSIVLHAMADPAVPQSGTVAISGSTQLFADARAATGNGGSIQAIGDTSLRVYGSFSVRGGTAGGNGGSVETSAPTFDLAGIRIDASAPGGKAGTWLIDPYDVTIVNGAATGSLTGNPFDPVADATVQDGDINAALDGGASVTIRTGAVAAGAIGKGDIFLDDAQIYYSKGSGTRTLTLEAHRSVRANTGTTIGATAGPLNVAFTADANGFDPAVTGGGQVSYSGQIYTNGGNVAMGGAWANSSNTACSVCLDGAAIDTRGGNTLKSSTGGVNVFNGGTDGNAGGSVQLTGRSNILGTPAQSSATGGVYIGDSTIRTSTGNVDVFGSNTAGSGVVIDTPRGQGGIYTTSGNILVNGVGSYAPSSNYGPSHGVVIGNDSTSALNGGPTLQSESGNIAVRGLRLAGGAQIGDGVLVGQRALVTTKAGGNVEITGESQGGGAGVRIASELTGTFGTIAAGRVDGSSNVVLRAANDGSADALVLGVGSQVSGANVINVRPGGLDLTGGATDYAVNAVDRTGNAITLGGASGNGFSVSSDELGRLATPTLVAGSNAHAADITVAGAITTAGALTLQNEGGGNIVLNAPVNAQRLGLLSRGNVTQAAGAGITAATLMARSTAGSVLLDQAPNNVSAATVGGGAAGAFRYVDVDTVQLGSVSVTGFDAAGNAPQIASANSMAADTVFVRTLVGDLLLGTNVSSTNGTDLVAASRFQNLGGYTITGAPWRVWADTWVGETRGGLAGSGPLPNLFGCAYLGDCIVTVSSTDNHFIYVQRPTATVTIANAARLQGAPNPPFGYGITGLILGDGTGSFSGTMSTSAGPGSPPGSYPIDGSFASAAGYRVNVVPGELRVEAPPPPRFERPEFPSVDMVRETPNTYTFDRNIGQAPICYATGPLDGERSEQGNDVLAREWSKVRSRPNLLNCVDTERRNGCSDF